MLMNGVNLIQFIHNTSPNPIPARSALGADGLALGASLELECIAEFKN